LGILPWAAVVLDPGEASTCGISTPLWLLGWWEGEGEGREGDGERGRWDGGRDRRGWTIGGSSGGGGGEARWGRRRRDKKNAHGGAGFMRLKLFLNTDGETSQNCNSKLQVFPTVEGV
jgi:hypothetical protein